MPEGPEILYTNIYLKKFLKNAQIETIKSFTDKPAIIPKDYIGSLVFFTTTTAYLIFF